MDREKFLASIYLIIKDDSGRILFQRRRGTKLWSGFLGLPAGHVDIGENVYDAAIREAKEELDITFDTKNIVNTFVVNRRNKHLSPYFDVYFEIGSYTGDIKINEPLKCSELCYFSINELPLDVISFEKEALIDNLNGIKFGVVDIDEEKDMNKFC